MLYSQEQDTVKKNKVVHKAIYSKARKASILSACLPGLGQAYNSKKAFWKVPIIYAALGGVSYFAIKNQTDYKFYSTNLKAIYDDDPNTINSTFYDSDQLITLKRGYKKNRDLSIIIGIGVYLINIVDANVEAHLKTFDISDDLSLQLKPYGNFDYNNHLQTGLTIKLNFK